MTSNKSPKRPSPIRMNRPSLSPRTKIFFSYIGGKFSQAEWLLSNFPKNESIKTYVEVFGGMYWLYLKHPKERFKHYEKVVYNDFNPNHANLWNCLTSDRLKLLEEADKIPFQRKNKFKTGEKSDPLYKLMFREYKKEILNKPYSFDRLNPNYERASKYVYLLTNTYNSQSPDTNKFNDLKYASFSKYRTFLNRLLKGGYKHPLSRIDDVNCMDFADVIKKYDTSDTFFYVDPPYYGTEYLYGKKDNFEKKEGRDDHLRLAECLKNIKGKFMLSYYYFEQLEEWFPKNIYTWKEKEFHKPSAGKKGAKGKEIIIMNYTPSS